MKKGCQNEGYAKGYAKGVGYAKRNEGYAKGYAKGYGEWAPAC